VSGCLVHDCPGEHHGRGYRGRHFQEWRRTGERPELAAERSCWLKAEDELDLGHDAGVFSSEEKRREAGDVAEGQ
jgi:hypothetical protein